MKTNVYLAGFMGAGKSRIGRLLARRFAASFIDTDGEIEQEAGKTIKDIFRDDGEKRFREIESRVIQDITKSKNGVVVALGGGALNDPVNLKSVAENGIVIYLKSAPEEILKRVRKSDKRPLLDIPEGEDREEQILQRIRSLLARRKAVYEQAHIIINRDRLNSDELVENIYQRVSELWSS